MVALEYSFRVIDASAINQAFAAIERRAAQHNQRMNRMFGTPVSRPSGAASAASVPMAARVSARARVSEEEKAAKQAETYWRRAHQRSVDQRIRDDAKAHRERMRQVAQEERAQRRVAERATSARRNRAREVIGTAGNSVSRSLGAVGTYGGAALGLAGSFAMGSAVQTQMSEAAMASKLANQAGNPALKGALLQQAQSVKGFTGAEALQGMEAFVTKTGDLETARTLIGDMGQLALATSTDLGDLGATAGQAFNVLRKQIDDPVERIKELNKLLAVLAQQGSMGAVEIRDLAQDFGKLGAATYAFEGGAPELLRSMGAFAQIAVDSGGAESSADASTAASRLANDIVMHKDRFKALGVDYKSKTDKTKLRSPIEIMLDTLDATGGDIEKTTGLFGIESGKIFRGLSATYSEAEKREKGSGRKAVMDRFGQFAGAKLTQAEINNKAQSRLEDSDLQFKEAMKAFNAEVGSKLLPTLTNLVPEFARMLPYVSRAVELFAKMVDEFARNPLESIGKLIAAKVAIDIASAQIGGAAKEAITKALSRFSPAGGAAGAPGATPAGGMLSAAGAGAAVGISIGTAILTAGVVNFEKGEADIKRAGEILNLARDSMSPDEVRAKRAEIEKMYDERNRTGMTESIVGAGLSALSYAGPAGWAARSLGFDDKAIDSTARSVVGGTIDQNRETELRSYQLMIDELRKLEAALEKNTNATAGNTSAAKGPNRGDAPTSPVKG